MMFSLDKRVMDLGREYPEWKPWLAVIEEVLREATDPTWEVFVPGLPAPKESNVPLLAGATLALDLATVARWWERLMRAASQSGTSKMSTLKLAQGQRVDAATLFTSSLCQNGEWLKETAINLGVDPEALQAVAVLMPVPFLQACSRLWARSIVASWMEGYCPVCGAWPALTEVRGIERRRYVRCGRCGAEWQAHCLSCPFCALTDHQELVSLVPEKSGSTRTVDACKRCFGYVKSFTVLQGSPAAGVMLDDLASVDLDVAALAQGYKRPEGTGYCLDVTIANDPSRGSRWFPWRAS
jgi:FdhE protein